MVVKADITIDIDKQIGNLQNLTNLYNARVGDTTPLTIQWYKNGLPLDCTGLRAFIVGHVGDGTYNQETDKIDFPPDSSLVEASDDGSGTLSSGLTTLLIPKQMWQKSGIFSGYVGLKSSNGAVYTGKNIWFKVLGNVLESGIEINYFVQDFEKAISQANGRINQALQDLKSKYDQEVKAHSDALLDDTAQLRKLAASVGEMMAQIDANNIVKKTDYDKDIAEVKSSISQRLAQINLNPVGVTNADYLKITYPSGADGIFITADTGHKWIYINNSWTDCGIYQSQGLSSADRSSIDNGLKGLGTIVYGTKAPYDDLDTLPSNTILTYPNVENVAHLPDVLQYDAKLQGITITTYNYLAGETAIGGTVQVLHTSTNDRFWRIKWGESGSPYGPWNKPMFSKFEVFFANTLKPPFNSCDDLPDNTLVIYSNGLDQVKNSPKNVDHGAILTFNLRSDSYGKFQLLYLEDNTYMRMWWGSKVAPQGWQLLTYRSDNKEPVSFTSNDNLDIPPQYQDLNTLPLNQVVTYANKDNLKNYPNNFGPATVMTYGKYRTGAIQILIDNSGKLINRVCWGKHETYTNWQSGIWKIPVAFKDDVPAEYQDLNTLPLNQVVTYSSKDNLKNYPNNFGPATVMTYGSQDTAGQVQLLVDNNGKAGCRICDNSGNYGNWTVWGGYEPQPTLALFRSIGIIGDSYASGELAIDKYADHYNMSWGQILGRKIGASIINFSRGGQTTKGWLSDTERGLGLLNKADALDLYIIALGINDYQKLGDPYLGSDTDIDSGADTYYGNYGKIIKAIQTKAPMAKIVIATLSQTDAMAVKYNSAIKNIAKHFGLPYVTLTDDPFFTSEFYLNNMYGGHPTGPVYAEMANAYERLISRAMVNNLSYFENYENGFETDNSSDLKRITSPQLENRISNLESRLTNLEHGTTQE